MTPAPRKPVKKDIGYRNTFDVSPWIKGKKITRESGFGLPIILKYGEIEGVIFDVNGRSDMEHQGCSLKDYLNHRELCGPDPEGDFYLYVDATNSDDGKWDHDHYLRAGPVTYCTSFAHLAHYTCIKCSMGDDGQVTNCGARFQKEK